MQELFHLCGTKFTELTEIMDKVSAVQRIWAESLLPCLQELFIEQKLIDDTNDESMIYYMSLMFQYIYYHSCISFQSLRLSWKFFALKFCYGS